MTCCGGHPLWPVTEPLQVWVTFCCKVPGQYVEAPYSLPVSEALQGSAIPCKMKPLPTCTAAQTLL